MSTLETLAAKLADDTMDAMAETGDDRLYVEIGNVLAAASQSLEEAYLTEVRVRLAERTARAALNTRLAKHRKTVAAAKATERPQTPPAAPAKGPA